MKWFAFGWLVLATMTWTPTCDTSTGWEGSDDSGWDYYPDRGYMPDERHQQFAVISGIVIDGNTKAPIEGAIVYILSSQRTDTTSILGQYRFDSLALNHTYTVTVEHNNFETAVKRIPVKETRSYTCDLALRRLQ